MGVFVAFILSLINVVRRAAAPPVDVLSNDGTPHAAFHAGQKDRVLTAPGVVVLRFAGPIFFANANRFASGVKDAVTAAKPQGARHLVLDLEAVNDIDVTAAARIAETLEWVRAQGLEVSYSRVRTVVRERLDHFDLIGDTDDLRHQPRGRRAAEQRVVT